MDRVVETPMAGIDERLHRYSCGDEVDTYAVVTERFLVVIDTHSTPALGRQLRDLVDPLRGNRTLLVVNTHADYDHAWGNAAFEGSLILGHRRCAARLQGDEFAAALERRRSEQPGRFDDMQPLPPNVLVDGPASIMGGDLTLELIPAPGHTEDHLALYLPELRILLAADAAEWPWPHVPDGAGLAAERASLERLAALDPVSVLPCHGGVHDAALLAVNAAYYAAVAADPSLTLDTAAAMAGADVATLPQLYRDFHEENQRAGADH
jgi:glyoxylase-like metal-dependent hydrolase (beta-lactamase superfamily II)